MKTIYDFYSSETPTTITAGGKALKLMELFNKKMPVPAGMVLTTEFFTPWIDILKKSDAWNKLTSDHSEMMIDAAKYLQTLCSALKFSQDQRRQFDESLYKFQEKAACKLFAVRSSSPEEDMDTASFAGGYETVLGVNTEQLETAVKDCFMSCFDPRVFSYKKEREIPTNEPRIAVLIQKQLDADCAGVGFSLNPLNNCYDEAVINANFGLGESVVSGEVEPDMFVVDKVKHVILDEHIGRKQFYVTLNNAGGTIDHLSEKQSKPCINEKQVFDIVSIICQVENYYKMPIDIEWAIEGDRLYLLQVRPITTYHPLPDEMITKPGEQKRLYANSTLIEQGIDEPLSVLGTDFIRYILKQMGSVAGGDIVGIDGMAFTAGGQYYMNLSNSIQSGGKELALAPGSSNDETVLAILDNIDLSEYCPKQLPPKVKKARRGMIFSALPMIRAYLQATKNPEAFMEKYYKELPSQLLRFSQDAQDCKTLHEHAEQVTSGLDFFLMKYGMPTMFGANRARKSIAELFESADINDHLINISMALPHNKTTEMGEALYKIAAAKEFQRFNNIGSFFEALNRGELSSDFTSSWYGFLEEFGARCPKEIDVATPRPKENPAILFEQAKALALSISGGNDNFFEKNKKKRDESHQALLAVAQKMGKGIARQFTKQHWILYNFGGFRESGKHYITKAVDMFRQEALRVGQRLVAEGRLDKPEQVFDLAIEDLDNAIDNPNMELRKLIQERTAFINRLRKSHYAVRIIDSRGKIYMPKVSYAENGGFSGIAVSPGLIKGRAKVLHAANEKDLLPGEILVARATDPGWTPLFINAAGIVLEIGGILQHGAVVAREYGIPCVSGITDATQFISDGQLIEVDGSNGVVKLLDGIIPVQPPVSEEIIQAENEKTKRKQKELIKRKIKQTIMIIFPLILSPFLVLFVSALFYTLAKIIMGVGILQAIMDFELLVAGNTTIISLSTWLFVAITALFALWRNKKKIRTAIIKVLSRKQSA